MVLAFMKASPILTASRTAFSAGISTLHFGGWRPFIEATQWRQYYALKYQIETIRQRPELDGYVITELTDVHWEVNGMMDMARNPRVFHEALAWLNADTFITPRAHAPLLGW